jgi:hypothetical protein
MHVMPAPLSPRWQLLIAILSQLLPILLFALFLFSPSAPCPFIQDLLTDEPFTRKDIMHLQDPLNVSGRLISDFHHVRFVSDNHLMAPGRFWSFGFLLGVTDSSQMQKRSTALLDCSTASGCKTANSACSCMPACTKTLQPFHTLVWCTCMPCL